LTNAILATSNSNSNEQNRTDGRSIFEFAFESPTKGPESEKLQRIFADNSDSQFEQNVFGNPGTHKLQP
jgi:hypothetical protein